MAVLFGAQVVDESAVGHELGDDQVGLLVGAHTCSAAADTEYNAR